MTPKYDAAFPSMKFPTPQEWLALTRAERIELAEAKKVEATSRRIKVGGVEPSRNEQRSDHLLIVAKEDLYESDDATRSERV